MRSRLPSTKMNDGDLKRSATRLTFKFRSRAAALVRIYLLVCQARAGNLHVMTQPIQQVLAAPAGHAYSSPTPWVYCVPRQLS